MAEPPFRSVAIVGLGLIGGSIAFGLRRRWPDLPVIGVDVPAVAAAAHQAEAITDVRERLADLRQVDLVVLATPVPAIVELVGEAGRAGLTGLVTDVGSTKRRIMEAASTSGVRFVGGHPMAGAARGGFSQARADLLHGREWLLVPAPGRADADQDVAGLERLARGLGAVPRRLTADAHDRVMAYVSHLPQLLASALMSAAGAQLGAEGLNAAGPGFGDMTRLAASPVDIWQGILATNADYVAEAVRALLAVLPPDAAAVGDPVRIEQLFRDAHKWASRN